MATYSIRIIGENPEIIKQIFEKNGFVLQTIKKSSNPKYSINYIGYGIINI